MNSTFVKEIFSSVQGEGLYVGEKQLFVRFCGCNLACLYCDTDYSKEGAKEYTPEGLRREIFNFEPQTVSLTGGEPLLCVDFLKELLPLGHKIYLETNGILWRELKEIIDKIDVVAMDIKLQSATGQENQFCSNEQFLEIARQKEVFVKIVFDKNITDDEIETVCAFTGDSMIILQPKMPIDCDVEVVFEKFYSKHKNLRLIPQTHKFLHLK